MGRLAAHARWCLTSPRTRRQWQNDPQARRAIDNLWKGRGVLHRDVKPANVILAGDGRARLADFGIAQLVDATRVTRSGFAIGTAAYLAPEQVQGERISPAVDLYALGLVLLECVTGRREYDGPVLEAALARLHRRPRISAELPAGWRLLLEALTADDPRHDRPLRSPPVQPVCWSSRQTRHERRSDLPASPRSATSRGSPRTTTGAPRWQKPPIRAWSRPDRRRPRTPTPTTTPTKRRPRPS